MPDERFICWQPGWLDGSSVKGKGYLSALKAQGGTQHALAKEISVGGGEEGNKESRGLGSEGSTCVASLRR